MATTQLADIIEPSVFARYVIDQTKSLSALFASGIVQPSAEVAALIVGGGSIYNMPFWNDLGNTVSNVGSDNPASSATALKVTAANEKAVKHYRNQLWSAADLVSTVAGDDPIKMIGDRVAAYWSRDMQRILIASLTGVLADNVANDAGDMINNVATDAAGTPTSAELVGPATILDAKQTMGDAGETITGIAMHSVCFTRLQKDNVIAYMPAAETNVRIPTYLGKTVIVDDGLPAVAGTNRITYTSILFGAGAVAQADGAPKVPVEIDRAPAQGDGEGIETLHNRQHFVLHPRGISFIAGSVVGKSPTNAELALAANWNRVYQRKSIPIAFLKTNG